MTVRIYTYDDFTKCVELFINVFNQEPWNDNWTTEYAGQYLKDFMDTPGFRGIVYEDDSIVKGFIFGTRKKWWSGDEFLINELCVEIDEQRRGIGTEMLNYLENILKDEKIERITLLTDKGIPAEEFYKKKGFIEIERLLFMSKEIM